MYPTENQAIYLASLEEKLESSIISVLVDEVSADKKLVIGRRFPQTMSNEDVQIIISAINQFTAMNKPLLWRREHREAFHPKNFESYLSLYRTLTKYYDLPLESDLVRSFTE